MDAEMSCEYRKRHMGSAIVQKAATIELRHWEANEANGAIWWREL
jgi:hypothetical protein